MAVIVILGVLGLVIGLTAYACRNQDGKLPDDRTSL